VERQSILAACASCALGLGIRRSLYACVCESKISLREIVQTREVKLFKKEASFQRHVKLVLAHFFLFNESTGDLEGGEFS
jgi:hypothetical protein